MPNPNSLNNNEKSVEGNNDWNTVANEAGKMDKFDLQVAKEAAQATRDFEAKKEQLNNLRDQITNLAQPSREYYADTGLDIREVKHDTSKLEGEASATSREMMTAKKKAEALSTEEGRQAAAEELRQEAERKANEQKYFEAGIRNERFLIELQSLDERIAATTDPNAKAALERAKEEWRQKTIAFGKALLEEPGVKETEENNEAGLPTEEQVKNERPKEDSEKIREFAEKIAPEALRQPMIKDKARIDKLLRKIDRFGANNEQPSFFERRQHKKDVSELIRYGYNPTSESTELFKTLSGTDYGSPMIGKILEDAGKRRAEDWKSIDLRAKGKFGREFKKALKKNGFSKMPEKWDDEDFTADEISRMATLARSAYYEEK